MANNIVCVWLSTDGVNLSLFGLTSPSHSYGGAREEPACVTKKVKGCIRGDFLLPPVVRTLRLVAYFFVVEKSKKIIIN